MRVFISWSGERSRAIAELLHRWLPRVIHAAEPYFSPDDITKGARWGNEIASALEEINIGILCLTRDNLQAPWIMFEAGALSSRLKKARVCPLLFGVAPHELVGPLTGFQSAEFSEAGVRKVVQMINSELEEPLSADSLRDTLQAWWPRLSSEVEAELAKPEPESTPRPSRRALLEAILSTMQP